MPIYDFRCRACGERFEELVAYKDKERVRCPRCAGAVQELPSGFAATGGGAAAGRAAAAAPRFT